jgi:hypothetical protein
MEHINRYWHDRDKRVRFIVRQPENPQSLAAAPSRRKGEPPIDSGDLIEPLLGFDGLQGVSPPLRETAGARHSTQPYAPKRGRLRASSVPVGDGGKSNLVSEGRLAHTDWRIS